MIKGKIGRIHPSLREKAHADEAHIRAMLAQAEAEKGRVMPIGAFVPAGLVPDPPSHCWIDEVFTAPTGFDFLMVSAATARVEST